MIRHGRWTVPGAYLDSELREGGRTEENRARSHDLYHFVGGGVGAPHLDPCLIALRLFWFRALWLIGTPPPLHHHNSSRALLFVVPSSSDALFSTETMLTTAQGMSTNSGSSRKSRDKQKESSKLTSQASLSGLQWIRRGVESTKCIEMEAQRPRTADQCPHTEQALSPLSARRMSHAVSFAQSRLMLERTCYPKSGIPT